MIEGGEKLPAGTLLLSCVGAIEVRRDGRIDGPDDNPDYYIGGGVVDDTRLYYFTSADYAPVIVDHSGNLYNSMGNKGMIAGYKAGTLPSEPEEITADIIRQQDGDVFMYNGQMYYCKQNKDKPEKHCTAVPNSWIGSENVTDNAYKKTYRYQNCMVSSDGKHLVASSDCGTGSVLMLWKNLPDESEAIPDTVYEFDMLDTLNDTAVYTDGAATMLMAGGRNSLYIWNNINTALAGEVPDYYLREKIGNVAVNEIQSFAFDGTYFYLSDNNGIYIFNGIPTKDQAPESTLNYQGASIEVTNCENGITYLAIKANEPVIYTREEALKNGEKYVLKGAVRELVVGVENGSKDGKYITEQDQICRFGGVGGIIVTKEGKVMVSDNGFGRIIIWDSIDEAVNEGNTNVKSATRTELGYGNHYYNIYDVLFADDSNQYHSMVYDIIPIESSDTFYRPYSLAYDGMYLWVGDFKFSGGIKRFR